MEGVESKTQLLGEDNQISSQISIRLAEYAKGFQKYVKEITDLMKQDINFSKVTAKSYDQMKIKLSKNLSELSRVHGVLTDLLAELIKEFNKKFQSQIKKHHLDSSDSSSSKVSEVSHNLEKDIQDLAEENTKLKGKIQEIESDIQSQLESEQDEFTAHNAYFDVEKSKVVELQKQVTNLLLVVSDFNSKIITIGEELKASSRKLLFAKYLLSEQLEQQASKQKAEENHQALALLHKQIDSHSETVTELQQKVAAEISARDDQIKEFETKINQYATEISDMKSTHEAQEDKWNADIGKMEIELKEKCRSLDELNKKLEELMLEKDCVDARLDTLQAEKSSQDKLVQEMESSLKSLQAERARAGEISARDDQIKEFETKINQYETEISDMKSTHEAREDKWNADIRKMEIELKEKCRSHDELNKKLEALMLEKDGVDARLDTLQAEKRSQDNLVQEMESRLTSLQAERAGVLVSFKNVKKLKDELNLKLVELKQEMHKKKEVRADTA